MNQIEVLEAEIARHPGLRAEVLLECLIRSVYFFKKNHLLFVEALDQFESIVAQPETRTWPDNSQLHHLMMEMMRHLHNFLAAAFTLACHMRKMVRTSPRLAEIRDEYERRSQAHFSRNGLSQFVQGLRNYFLHEAVPSHSTVTKLEQGKPANVSLVLNRSNLLNAKDWNATARAFLERQPQQVVLRDTISTYCAHVDEFHDWFDGVLRRQIGRDLEELAGLRDQYQEALGITG